VRCYLGPGPCLPFGVTRKPHETDKREALWNVGTAPPGETSTDCIPAPEGVSTLPRGTRRLLTPTFKAQVLRALRTSQRSQAELCRQPSSSQPCKVAGPRHPFWVHSPTPELTPPPGGVSCQPRLTVLASLLDILPAVREGRPPSRLAEAGRPLNPPGPKCGCCRDLARRTRLPSETG
jgi:hypothetical protein